MAAVDNARVVKMASGTIVGEETALTANPVVVPAGGTGAAAGGWDTAGNRDTAISTLNDLRTRIAEIETILQQYGFVK